MEDFKMKKTFLTVLSVVLALVVALSLCACDAGNSEVTPDATATATTKTSATATAKPTVPPATTAPATTAPATTAPAPTDATTTEIPNATVPATTVPAPTATPFVPQGDVFAAKGKATIDGKIDATWSKTETVELNEVKKDSPKEDTVVKASMMWDEAGFYFLFEIKDSAISQTSSVGDYQNDGIYLYISEDMQDDAGAFADFMDGTYQFALISEELELVPRYGYADDVEDYEVAYQKTEDGMIIEFFYKPAYAVLEVGTQMYLDYQYNDCANGTRAGAMGWYNDTDDNAFPDMWGVVQLVESIAKS